MPKPTEREQAAADHEISEHARDVFMRMGLDAYANLAIVASAFRVTKKNVYPVDVIAAVRKEGDDYIFHPLAIVVSNELLACLVPPKGSHIV